MKTNFKKFTANIFACMLSFLAISTVNSACVILLGQDEEPESLKRFKKI